MAQLGARLDGIEEVVGSNPIGSTNFKKIPRLCSGRLLRRAPFDFGRSTNSTYSQNRNLGSLVPFAPNCAYFYQPLIHTNNEGYAISTPRDPSHFLSPSFPLSSTGQPQRPSGILSLPPGPLEFLRSSSHVIVGSLGKISCRCLPLLQQADSSSRPGLQA